ncbi:MAG: hypothetical protein KIT10_06905 [Flavobacteriales bacterium]|nr:hypothetical protein [Flavobacteriales bacterium]
MQAPKDILLAEAVDAVELSEVLSPESHVFVALMSVEEGPNKASFLPVPRSHAKGIRSSELLSPPLAVELPR